MTNRFLANHGYHRGGSINHSYCSPDGRCGTSLSIRKVVCEFVSARNLGIHTTCHDDRSRIQCTAGCIGNGGTWIHEIRPGFMGDFYLPNQCNDRSLGINHLDNSMSGN